MSTKLLKPIEPKGQAEYGLDAPGSLWQMIVGLVISLGLAVKLPGWWRLIGVGGTAWWLNRLVRWCYAARFGQFNRRETMLMAAGETTYSRILDLGSGRGLVAIGAARRWPKSKLVAVDDWKPGRRSSEENLRSNLDLEELGGRIHVFELAGPQLPSENGSFDLILSNLYLHSLSGQARQDMLDEAIRVLKPGGCLVIKDNKHTGSYYAWLKEHGLQVSTLDEYQTVFLQKFNQPGRFSQPLLIAKKPVL